MNLSCYVLDDEYHAIEILTEFIRRTPGLELSGSSTSPLVALEEITATAPALTFTDIDMPEINGLEFAGLVHPFSTVIFTTSYREYAPEAFEKEAADYLLKPISYERFLTCIQKVRKHLPLKIQAKEKADNFFFIKTGVRGTLIRLNVADIVYVSAALNYIEIFTIGQKMMTYLSVAEILTKLPAATFSRIHKSYIINLDFLRTVEYAQVKMEGNIVIPVGRAFRSDFRLKIKERMLVSKWDQSE